MIALARHLADSTLFALVIAGLCLCMKRPGPATRHALWLIAAAKFVLPIALLSWLGRNLRALLPPSHIAAAVPSIISQWVISPTVSEPLTATSNASRPHISILILGVWLVGSFVTFSLWFRQLRDPCESFACPNDVEQVLLRLKTRLALKPCVRVRFSDAIAEPALVGFWKPIVILPTGLAEQLSAAELESVILHELAHAKRWDNCTAAFSHIVSCTFWFHPVVWWIESRLHRERELACDEMVIRCGAAPGDYVGGILKVCEFCLSEDVAGISRVSGPTLKNRMEEIMSLSSEGPLPHVSKALVAAVVVVIVGLPLGVGLVATSNGRVAYANSQDEPARQSNSQKPITCAFADIPYPEGTVIQQGDGPEQMCARVLDEEKVRGARPTYFAEWIPTSESIRRRNAAVVRLAAATAAAPVSCSPKPSSGEGLCTCEGEGPFSNGSVVNSAKGPFQLRCEKGKWVQTSTPNKQQ